MSLRLGSRGSFVLSGSALAGLVAAMACGSSNTSNTVSMGDDGGSSGGSSGTGSSGTGSSGTGSSGTGSSGTGSSGTGSSGTGSSGTGSGGTSSSGVTGDGGSCPMVSDAWVGVKLVFQVVWGMGGASGTSAASNAGGPSPVTIWLLSHDVGGATFTGSTKPCGTRLPDLELNAAGDIAVGGVPIGGKGLVNPVLSDALFDAVTRTYNFTGGMQGFNPGEMLSVPSVVGLLGLKASSTWGTASTAWPAYCATSQTCSGATCTGGTCTGGMIGAFNATDFTDDDNDNKPGVTAAPLMGPSGTCTGNCSYYFPPTAVGLGGSAPAADKVYVVSRNQFSLHGTRGADCNKGTGKAHITLFDNHVVGCHVSGGGDCTSAQAQFIDQNRPIYADANNMAFSSSSPADNGDVTVLQFPQGSTPTCAMVRQMLP
jgi:hypothetical protein